MMNTEFDDISIPHGTIKSMLGYGLTEQEAHFNTSWYN